eukprot:TRINITY_DN574_c0_g1_i1.p1 TRINITY_DN574_c0_g1~~TRINITY_DN574_c0_g1_i1.p1  ORF type:complete len:1098 (+),score=335.38 TRINITY_DN574_c0_g1_i1:29-3295(+)
MSDIADANDVAITISDENDSRHEAEAFLNAPKIEPEFQHRPSIDNLNGDLILKDDGRRPSIIDELKGDSLVVTAEKLRTSFDDFVGRTSKLTKDEVRRLSLEEPKAIQEMIEVEAHIWPVEEISANLDTNLSTGLDVDIANVKLDAQGPNRLSPPEEVSKIIKFIGHLTGFFSLLLWGGALLSLVGYFLDSSDPANLYICFALLFVVLATGIFSYIQEAQSADVMKGFLKMIPQECEVLRSGEITTISAENLVIGDVVLVKSGMKIPADLRLFENSQLKVDNSPLTGESEPQSRGINKSADLFFESHNLVFYGTLAVEGSAKGVVYATGDDTFVGSVAALTKQGEGHMTTMQIEIARFVKIISTIAIILGVVFFIAGLFIVDDIIQNVLFGIGIIVANVPEGLLATVTVSLKLTSVRLAERNVLVRNLDSVETLGSTSVICSDKTGTLTQNVMSVSHLFFDNGFFSTTPNFADGKFDNSFDEENSVFVNLFRVVTLNSRARFASPNECDDTEVMNVNNPLKAKIVGDASETGYLRYSGSSTNIDEFRANYPKIAELPFNSTNKFMVTVHVVPEEECNVPGGQLLLTMKGAPERIMKRCTRYLTHEGIKKINEDFTEQFQCNYNRMGGYGERVLGFAQTLLDAEKYRPETDFNELITPTEVLIPEAESLTFLGLVSLIDPPRDAVPEAVNKCRTAGVKVIMVTGDHPLTAQAIAKKVGILSEDKPVSDVPKKDHSLVIHGDKLRSMTDEELEEALKCPEIVFARTSPQQKLRIVKGCQALNHIVAVTGDGVNDSPALQQADIGVAMNISGNDVSREAADMILIDDNFATIVNGIEEGRLIFDNLKKSIAYTLSSNIPEIMPFLFFITVGLPLPLSTIMILCVDLFTDLLPAISFARETAEKNLMDRPPRTREDRLVNAKLISFSYLQIGLIQFLAGFFTYFVVFSDHGISPGDLFFSASDFYNKDILWKSLTYVDRSKILRQAQTAYFVSIIVVQYADLIICRTRTQNACQHGMCNNTWSIMGIISETLLGMLFVYAPVLNTVLFTEPLDAKYLLPGWPFFFIIVVYDEVRKLLIRMNPKGWVAKYTEW